MTIIIICEGKNNNKSFYRQFKDHLENLNWSDAPILTMSTEQESTGVVSVDSFINDEATAAS